VTQQLAKVVEHLVDRFTQIVDFVGIAGTGAELHLHREIAARNGAAEHVQLARWSVKRRITYALTATTMPMPMMMKVQNRFRCRCERAPPRSRG